VIVFRIIGYLLELFLLVLIARLVFDWVMVFARDFRPKGLLAAFLEVIYSLTDPPLRVLRRIIPPLRVGSVAIDLGFIILFIAVQVLAGVFFRLS
jgi:YggT family protein